MKIKIMNRIRIKIKHKIRIKNRIRIKIKLIMHGLGLFTLWDRGKMK